MLDTIHGNGLYYFSDASTLDAYIEVPVGSRRTQA